MKPLGKFIILVLVAGIALGVYRVWSSSHGGGKTGASGSGFHFPNFSGGGATANNGGGSSGDGDIEVLTTATKQGWLQQEIDTFNAQHKGQYHVALKLLESRDALHAILDGKEHPAIWSPSSPVWIGRLSEVWAQGHGGTQIASMTDPGGYRVFFKSPLVFLTTRQKARFLKPLLGGPHPWAQVRELSLGKRRTPWGTFAFSHADPLNASSGMLTMSLIVNEFAQEHGLTGSLEQSAGSRSFTTYLTEVDRKFLYDPAALGSSKLEAAFVADPGRRDFITAYESAALESVSENPSLAVIYPSPTVNADQAAVVLNAGWVSDDQRKGAQEFLTFLGGASSLRDGLQYHFRPAQSSGDLSLAPQLANYGGQGFQQYYSAIELPPYGALNEAANQWRIYVAHLPAQK